MKFQGKLLFGSMAVLGTLFTSCSKETDLYDSDAVMSKLKTEYTSNFVKKYGAIDPSQTWDFTSMNPVSTLPSTGSSVTRASEVPIDLELTGTGNIMIEKAVIDWMHENMKAGKNNTKKGSPFYMVTQKNTFTIVPMYQGKATYFWELWVNVGGKEKKIWSKYEHLEYKTSDGVSHTLDTEGVPAEAVEIDAPTFTFSATEGIKMYFFLKVWKTDQAYANGDKVKSTMSSLDHKMLALQGIDKPANVPEDNEVTIIGCEDGTDNDYEDLVFMMYGKPAPPVEHVDEVEVRETKRYMMEDLGSSDDFDFNDVVVDVSNVYKNKITYQYDANGALVFEREEEVPGSRYQEAIVRAAGGTLDFTLEIGTTTITSWTKSVELPPVSDMKNTGWQSTPIYYSGTQSELATFRIKDNDWNPKTNNIKVIVEGRGENTDVKTITFPKKGEAPMIIAVEPGTDWMKERNSVPKGWWTE